MDDRERLHSINSIESEKLDTRGVMMCAMSVLCVMVDPRDGSDWRGGRREWPCLCLDHDLSTVATRSPV